MQSTVNKNIDKYQDDFFKGMSLKQTAMSALTLCVGAGSFFFFHLLLKVPQAVALYLVFPIALPFAMIGFVRIDDGSILTYLRRRHDVMVMPIYHYRPLAFAPIREERIYKRGNQKDESETRKREEPMLGPFTEEP